MDIKGFWRSTKKRTEPVWGFFYESVQSFSDDNALRLAAALAFYSLFSLAPLLVIAIAVAGFIFGEQAAQGEIVAQIEDAVGRDGAVFIEDMIARVREQEAGIRATVIGVATMLFGALTVFSALQDVLNMIWSVRPDPRRGLGLLIKRRLLSFLMIVLFGLLLLVSLFFSAVISAAQIYLADVVDTPFALWQATDMVVWFAFFTILFAVVYKFLPDVDVSWGDVSIGALMTSFLFTVGKYAIGLYLGRSSVGSVFGAAGTLVVISIWIYYSWVIVFLGAEMTQVYARRFGGGIKPSVNAVRVQKAREIVREQARQYHEEARAKAEARAEAQRAEEECTEDAAGAQSGNDGLDSTEPKRA